MHIENTGAANAFDVLIRVSPPFRNKRGTNDPLPEFTRLSVLRSKQYFRTLVGRFDEISTNKVTIEIRWKKSPVSMEYIESSYEIDISQFSEFSILDSSSEPLKSIAKSLKKIDDHLRHNLRKDDPLKIKIYTELDEEREAKEMEEYWKSFSSGSDENGDGEAKK